MATITCVVVTPDETALETTADFVVLPLYDGELGVAASHSPMIGRLGFGELRLKTGSEVVRWYVDGGFAQVTGDVVTVLTNRAIPAEKIDTAAVSEQLAEAKAQSVFTDEELASRERAVEQARAQQRIAEKA